MPYGTFLIEMETVNNKKITSREMLQKLDAHYEKEEQIKREITQNIKQLRIIKDEIDMMQTLIMFQMNKELK